MKIGEKPMGTLRKIFSVYSNYWEARTTKFLDLVVLIFTGDTTYWYESGPVNDFLMENCKLLNTEYCAKINFLGEVEFTDKEPYYHKNITVRNCYFDKGRIININHVDNFVFEGNTSCGEMEISVKDCGKISVDENVKLV